MDICSLTVSYHPDFQDPNDVPKVNHFLFRNESNANQFVQELRKPHYSHADEILKLYEQNERGYLLQTVKNPSTLDFLYGGDLTECESDEEIIEEIVRFEIFNYDIKPAKFHPNNFMLYGDKITPFY